MGLVKKNLVRFFLPGQVAILPGQFFLKPGQSFFFSQVFFLNQAKCPSSWRRNQLRSFGRVRARDGGAFVIHPNPLHSHSHSHTLTHSHIQCHTHSHSHTLTPPTKGGRTKAGGPNLEMWGLRGWRVRRVPKEGAAKKGGAPKSGGPKGGRPEGWEAPKSEKWEWGARRKGVANLEERSVWEPEGWAVWRRGFQRRTVRRRAVQRQRAVQSGGGQFSGWKGVQGKGSGRKPDTEK